MSIVNCQLSTVNCMRLILKYYFIILFIYLCGVSCIPHRNVVYFQEKYRTKIDTSKIAALKKEYELTIAPNDIVDIHVHGHDEETYKIFSPKAAFEGVFANLRAYERGLTVDKNGNIEIPYVGTVHLQGLTITQARDTIRKKLSVYIDNPSVVVKMLSFYVTVLGDVARPGVFYAESERLSLMEALGKAGDLTLFGNRKNIKIVRAGRDGGESSFEVIDITSSDVINPYMIYLHPNDIVYVEPLRRKYLQNVNVLVSLASSVVSLTLVLVTLFFIGG